MNNPKYNAFLKVAEMGSIKHAADLLGYTQTGMSYLINTLEEELDIKPSSEIMAVPSSPQKARNCFLLSKASATWKIGCTTRSTN